MNIFDPVSVVAVDVVNIVDPAVQVHRTNPNQVVFYTLLHKLLSVTYFTIDIDRPYTVGGLFDCYILLQSVAHPHAHHTENYEKRFGC